MVPPFGPAHMRIYDGTIGLSKKLDPCLRSLTTSLTLARSVLHFKPEVRDKHSKHSSIYHEGALAAVEKPLVPPGVRHPF